MPLNGKDRIGAPEKWEGVVAPLDGKDGVPQNGKSVWVPRMGRWRGGGWAASEWKEWRSDGKDGRPQNKKDMP